MEFFLNKFIWLRYVSLVSFAVSTVVYLVGIRPQAIHRKHSRLQDLGDLTFWVATIALGIGVFGSYSGSLWTSEGGSLLVFSLGVLGILLKRQTKSQSFGVFIAPIATLILLLQFFFVRSQESWAVPHTWTGVLSGIHVLFAALGQGLAIYAFLLGMMYLQRQASLKNKQLLRLTMGQLPALDRLESALSLALTVGFVCMTISLATGTIYVKSLEIPITGVLSLKVIWAICVWLVYLICLIQLRWFEKPIRNVSVWSVVGFLILTMAFFGLGFFRDFGGLHR